MNPLVHFEDEADTEYREAGRWYDAKSAGLGVEFFNEIDAAVRRILEFPRAGAPVPRVPRGLQIRRLAVKRFPYACGLPGTDGGPVDSGHCSRPSQTRLLETAPEIVGFWLRPNDERHPCRPMFEHRAIDCPRCFARPAVRSSRSWS